MQLYLNFHDHIILVSGVEEALVRKLRDEFHYFVQESAQQVHTTLEIFNEPAPLIPPTVATKILETCTIYRIGTRKYLDYGDALTIWDQLEETVRIYSTQVDRLFELSFLAIHSLLGQKLETKGLCRIHAAAVSLGAVNALIMLPSKGGKSTLLTHLLNHPEVKIISDDMPLVDMTGRVHVFPSKISMNEPPKSGPLKDLEWVEFKRTHFPPKWTASLGAINSRIETQNLHQHTLLIAGFRLSQGTSILSSVPKWKMIPPLLEHMIIGFGLPQILEMFLNFQLTDVIKMIYHGLIRTFAASRLLLRSHCYYFYLGPDLSYNAQLVLDEMYEYENH